MNENEIFRLKGRIAISNLSREDVKSDNYSNNGIIIINRIVMSGEEFDRFVGDDG